MQEEKEKYKRIAKYYWEMNVALINISSELDVNKKPFKDLLIKGTCNLMLKNSETLRQKLYEKYAKEFPEEENPFHPWGWGMFQK